MAATLKMVPSVADTLKLFKLVEVEAFLAHSSQQILTIDQASNVTFRGLIQNWDDSWNLEEELPAFVPGQDYRLDAILEWEISQPDWVTRNRPKDYAIVDIPHWLRTIARRLQSKSRSRNGPGIPILRFIQKSVSGDPIGEAARELRKVANAVAEVERFTQSHENLVIMPVGNKLLLRPASYLTSGAVEVGQGLLPVSATSLEAIGSTLGFSADALEELEGLINSEAVREQDLQEFFERNPQLLLGLDYERAIPHPILRREEEADLIPDFILLPHADGVGTPKIVDLKLPKVNLVRRKTNRLGYLASVQEARDQLIEYRNYFADPSRAKWARVHLGMEVYMPDICVVIGRSASFGDAYERQRVRATASDLELLTYDDVLNRSRRFFS
ncbi:Shedu anti-phage system protein SduA domain-containing protein [Allokutzneria oryzae]|uniref:Shedu anti-phage system protein SduA domain-containing protein n=1 Tax=Allokutzneria oryzae TaxID=1378989 RepID=A0ABV5ZNE7_9PSEU